MTPADFADTGQWRLIIYISRQKMAAFLKHAIDKEKPIMELFRQDWHTLENNDILKSIENAVYDHPSLLDDYATDIILDTQCVTFAPSELIEDKEDFELEIFEALYPANKGEVLSDSSSDLTCLFSFCEGLESFISRTLPGARIRNNLAILIDHFKNKGGDAPRVYIDIRNGLCDIIAFEGKKLLAASLREWKAEDDIAYMIFHLLQTYNLSPEKSEIYLSGLPETRLSLTDKLRNFCSYVVKTTLPEIIEEYSLPPAVGIIMAK